MKRILAFLICAACLCLSACGVRNEENILEKIRDANLNSALQEKGRTVAYRADIYNVEKEIDSSYAYLDPDRVVYEAVDRTEINENGDVFGFNNVGENVYRYLFLDDTAKDHVIEVTGYIWNPDETVLSVNKKGGDLVVRAQDGGEESLANMAIMMAYYGYDVPDTFTIINEYILEPKTYEIKCYNVYANFGAEDFLLVENKRVDDPETYKVDPAITDAIHAEDSRTVTVIADPGTDNEVIYKQTIAMGSVIHVAISAEHPVLYTDEACTQECNGCADLYSDLTLYAACK